MLGLECWLVLFQTGCFALGASLIVHFIFILINLWLDFYDWLKNEIYLTYLFILCLFFAILHTIFYRFFWVCLFHFIKVSIINRLYRYGLNLIDFYFSIVFFFFKTLPDECFWFHRLWKDLTIAEHWLVFYYIRHIYWYFKRVSLILKIRRKIIKLSFFTVIKILYFYKSIYFPVIQFFLGVLRDELDFWWDRSSHWFLLLFFFFDFMLPNFLIKCFWSGWNDFVWWIKESKNEFFISLKLLISAPRRTYLKICFILRWIDEFHLPDYIWIFFRFYFPRILYYWFFTVPKALYAFTDRHHKLVRNLILWSIVFAQLAHEFACYV